jgi:hypothetical protein
MSKQKRANFRLAAEIPVHFLPVKAVPRYLISAETPLDLWYPGEISDLSLSGIRLIAPLKMDVESLIALHFAPPSAFLDKMVVSMEYQEKSPFGPRLRTVKQREEDFSEIETCGKILRISEEPLRTGYQYHVAFLNLSAEEEKELTRFITLSQRYELKLRRKQQER